jgi:hypothetical protein
MCFIVAPALDFLGNCGRMGLYSQQFATRPMSALGHVWTAPWQELSDVAAALVGCGHVSGLLMRRMCRWP